MCSTIALLRGGLPWIGALERPPAGGSDRSPPGSPLAHRLPPGSPPLACPSCSPTRTCRSVMSYFRRDGHFSCDRCDEHGLLRLLGHSFGRQNRRSEEHTSELQSRGHLVCRLLLEKTNNV